MCGRYGFVPTGGQMRGAAQAGGDVSPGQSALALAAGPAGARAVLMRWGFPAGGRIVINARAETAAQKPAFAQSVRERRCALAATCFYEWDGAHRQFCFRLPGEEVFYLGGLYDAHARGPHFCILTCAANASVRAVHDRMPLLLRKSETDAWLTDGAAASALLARVPPLCAAEAMDGQMRMW